MSDNPKSKPEEHNPLNLGSYGHTHRKAQVTMTFEADAERIPTIGERIQFDVGFCDKLSDFSTVFTVIRIERSFRHKPDGFEGQKLPVIEVTLEEENP